MKVFTGGAPMQKRIYQGLFILFFIGVTSIAFAQTEVTSVTASPQTFNPDNAETTTISVEATPGVTGLEVRVLSSDQTTVVRSGLTLTETTTGSYSTVWNGRNNGNALVPAGAYVLRVFNPPTSTFIGPLGSVTVERTIPVISVSASPDPFVPTGTNATTITVQATPGQTGLKARVEHNYNSSWYWRYEGDLWIPLTETSTPGVYTGTWNAVYKSSATSEAYVLGDETYRIAVYDGAGIRSTTTGNVNVSGVLSVSASPNPFTPGGTNLATITAKGGTGLKLEVRIYNSTTNALTRTLSCTEASGTYTAEWDGKDSNGNFAGAGTYRINVHNKDSGIRYDRVSTGVVKVAVFSISASPDPFVPTGSNTVTITVRADPLQSGFTVSITHPQSGTT